MPFLIFQIDKKPVCMAYTTEYKEATKEQKEKFIMVSSCYPVFAGKNPELGVKILSPQTNEVLTCGNQTYTFLQPAAKQESENDQSLVMTLEMDGLSVLLTGDISTKVERDILSNYSLSRLDIYKAAHIVMEKLG